MQKIGNTTVYILLLLVLKRIRIHLYLFVDVYKISEEKLLTKDAVCSEEKWVAVGNGWERNITMCPFTAFGLYKYCLLKKLMLKIFSFSDIYSILNDYKILYANLTLKGYQYEQLQEHWKKRNVT